MYVSRHHKLTTQWTVGVEAASVNLYKILMCILCLYDASSELVINCRTLLVWITFFWRVKKNIAKMQTVASLCKLLQIDD